MNFSAPALSAFHRGKLQITSADKQVDGMHPAAQVAAILVLLLGAQFVVPSGLTEKEFQPVLWWMAPFLSGGGYCSEAISFALALQHMMPVRITQHGDGVSQEFVRGLPADVKTQLTLLQRTPAPANRSIVVCHSEPGAWAPPLYQTSLCPPSGGALYKIGRTMFETDRLTPTHAERCNKMDEVWVPSQFHIETFSSSGVDKNKIFVVPESVDVDFFDPRTVQPVSLGDSVKPDDFVFLSIFKWEHRKGWDVLLRAFLSEFKEDEPVVLVMKTTPYHQNRTFGEQIDELLSKEGISGRPLARVVVKSGQMSQVDLAGMYRAANAFVLPSRGEGWGRPHVEAMAMELPVIATNWSGSTEFLLDDCSYPLPIDGLEEIPTGPFRGHKWATPSVTELRRLMRHVYENRAEAAEKGVRARRLMVKKYNPMAVAEIVAERVRIITKELGQKGLLHGSIQSEEL